MKGQNKIVKKPIYKYEYVDTGPSEVSKITHTHDIIDHVHKDIAPIVYSTGIFYFPYFHLLVKGNLLKGIHKSSNLNLYEKTSCTFFRVFYRLDGD